ncbi:ABC transporter substrate-binding protein [Gordoniibacillus kamchatkensis]|uniref:ABC transporter substrate-binding protein n=1 Tax=Gordoniibacillus kamchatkensis TaxID=1590651 RepID=A0ABR5AIE1_9BACL|nr:extracellular solute-binding protein [Paenibacillus sp. VKM B-2647]KIL40672.1 ABC transporter substrate-binding protein [Paenibacillus sp. VKM B-2647]
MNNKKSVLLLASVMVASGALLAACRANTEEKNAAPTAGASAGAQPDKVNADGMPIVKNPINLEFFAPKRFAASDWNNILLWQEYEKLTNVKVKWNTVDRDNLVEKRNILLAGGDYPDALYGNRLTPSDLMMYGEQGVFVKLNDLIDKYAPNFKKLLDQYPDVKKAITMPDGNIYSFPTVTDPEFKSMLTGAFMWYKPDWLEKTGLPEPQTTDDFYRFLKAIKEKDPNTIPLGGGPGWDYLGKYLQGAWGLGNRGTTHPYVDVDPATNELRFIPADDRYKEMLQYTNKLYNEGLIDKDFFTANADQIIAKGSKGVYAVIADYNPEAVYSNLKGYVGAAALKGPHGDRIYSYIGSPVGSPGQFVITKKNKYPEATVRWVDYLYSDEGSKMFFMGFKDKTYVEKPDGTIDYTDEIKHNPKGLTQDQAVSQYLVWPGVGYPGILKQNYFKGAEGMPASVEAAKKVEPAFIKERWAPFNYTKEETERMTVLRADIETYVKEMTTKFITGGASFDEWSKYTDTLKKMGLSEYMKIYKAGYERYKKN